MKFKFRKLKIEELHTRAKIIYYFIIAVSLIVLPLFSYISYFTYNITYSTAYFMYTLITLLPVIIATSLMVVLLYIGKKKFYEIYKKEEEHLYERLKRFYHLK